MQLVAYGAQDIYLTGNPQITFFKVVYRRHTNFAVESIEQTINGSVSNGSKVSVTIARNGDLLSRVYLQLKGALATGAKGFDAVDYVEVEVGGQVIDKHYGQWMKIWCDLTHGADKKAMLNKMLCTGADCDCDDVSTSGTLTTIPLQFWFCRNPGLALPLIALQYHEVKLNIKFCSPTNGTINGAEVWCDYIFLDTDERRRFAQVSHEYLIEQVQYNNGVSAKTDVQTELRFNHPVKELVWQTRGSGSCCNSNDGVAGVCTALLQLNGHDRFRKRQGEYFSTVQRYEHHTGANAGDVSTKAQACVDAGEIYMYSFALKPEEHQPSGTCNFSRIDNAVLNLDILSDTNAAADTAKKVMAESGVLDVYAVNYNVLRIMSGMGGLAYSN
jgi:hypothetical protein